MLNLVLWTTPDNDIVESQDDTVERIITVLAGGLVWEAEYLCEAGGQEG